ncbi:MAG: energy-coupling factor ABC transporter ATP-binding protein [Ruminococcus sp.]|nr:energy-coupling factor ABC transporter ATP-binding protein [Ruminococcus sp.]
MEILSVKNLSFTYPECTERALNNINLTVKEGEFVVLCGASGSGKTTLLRMFKKELVPHGDRSGEVLFKNTEVTEISDRQSAEKIGFVFQKPDQQIVTDKVWHELAFGLESLGYGSDYIRLRVGEMASYFGITSIFRNKTSQLSGGQKQLLNLASVMAMSPDVLILDEPTSQLDPIAAADFIATIKRLNTELGLTVILTEHRLQDVFPIADKVVVIEKGSIIGTGSPGTVCEKLINHKISVGFPSAVRIWQGSQLGGKCPLTVKEGREFINSTFQAKNVEISSTAICTKNAVELKEVFFRYEKTSDDIIKGLSLSVKQGEHFCILGGNGSGKTTTLKVISGILRNHRGKVLINNENVTKKSADKRGTALLPQNPDEIFLNSSVRDDYIQLLAVRGIKGTTAEQKIDEIIESLDIAHLMEKHPYDLSGGELQKTAMGKILLNEPKILLLDEPTKGLDAYAKQSLKDIIKQLKSTGVTIITVTHDVEFAAETADRCGLFFDGEVLSVSVPQKFFSMNNFYTTSASRIARERFKNAVTVEQVLNAMGVKNER